MPKLIIYHGSSASVRESKEGKYKDSIYDMVNRYDDQRCIRNNLSYNSIQKAELFSTKNTKDQKNFTSNVIKEEKKVRKNFFPFRLMSILKNPEFNDCISWSSDGKSFIINDLTVFSTKVLPGSFYKNVNVDSFIRKLHRWGFRSVTKGSNKHQYFHPLFDRDTPSLCREMMCKTTQVQLKRTQLLDQDSHVKMVNENNEVIHACMNHDNIDSLKGRHESNELGDSLLNVACGKIPSNRLQASVHAPDEARSHEFGDLLLNSVFDRIVSDRQRASLVTPEACLNHRIHKNQWIPTNSMYFDQLSSTSLRSNDLLLRSYLLNQENAQLTMKNREENHLSNH